MRVRKAEFVWAEDRELGGYGWVPKCNLDFNAMNGMGVAHDSMEHGDLTAGTLEEEMLAFGAMLYIRGDGGYWWQSYRCKASENMDGGIARFSREAFYARQCVLQKPKRSLHIDHETDIQEIVDAGWRALRAEFEYEPNNWAEFKRHNPEFKKRLAGWIRRGYQECKRRYNNIPAWKLCDVFRQISKRVDDVKHVEEGEELHIVLKLEGQSITPVVQRLYLEDLYPYEE